MNINKNSFLFDEISSLKGVGKKTKKYLSNKKNRQLGKRGYLKQNKKC